MGCCMTSLSDPAKLNYRTELGYEFISKFLGSLDGDTKVVIIRLKQISGLVAHNGLLSGTYEFIYVSFLYYFIVL